MVRVLGALGAWSIAVPYVGPVLGLKLDVAARLEIVDHVVPGLFVAASSLLMLLLLRRGQAGSLPSLATACTMTLAGLWITATHVPLLSQASDDLVPWGTAFFHIATGPLIVGLSLWLVMLELRTPEDA